MSSIFPSRRARLFSTLLAVLLAAACSTTSTTPPASPSSLRSLDYAGSQNAVENLDREISAAGQDSAKLNAIASRLIQTLRDPQATPAARQAVCERLRGFPADTLISSDNRAMFAAMLADERQINFARLALDLVRSEKIDELYLQVLASATPGTKLALVQSIGNRHIAAAVPSLESSLKDTDTVLANAAAKALGQIGTTESLAALSSSPNSSSAQVIEARLQAAHALGGTAATREFQSIVDNPAAPANLRAAAFRGLLFAEPSTAPTRFVAAISGEDATLKPVVIQAITTHPAPDLVPTLCSQLSTWDAPTQAAVIAALARKGDERAVSAISAATQHTDAEVRAAAIAALGLLPGNSDVALVLARIVAGDNVDDAKLARLSLARLTGTDVAETVIAGATNGEQPIRIVFLEQIASRNMSASLPLLLSTRQDPSPAVRAAALGALAEIAPPSEQHALLEWATAATDPNEQARALRALASVTLRDRDVAHRSLPVIEAIEHAEPAIALRLLPVLPRIGGDASAASAARLALRDDRAVSNAAISTLSRWTDRAGLLPLADVAEKTTSDSARATAMQGIVRYLERRRDVPSADLTSVVARLVPLCREPETRTRLVYLLGRSAGTDALELAKKLQADPALASVAADAAMIIESNRAGRMTIRASANEKQIKNMTDGKPATRWTVPATPGQWIEIDFKLPRPLRQIVMDNNGEPWGAPEKYEVYVTDDTNKPGDVRASGAGQSGKTTIDLPPNTRGRYLIIRHAVQSDDAVWAIAELIID